MEAHTLDPDDLKDFDAIPAFELPDNYHENLPSLLAHLSLEHGPVLRRPTPAWMRKRLGDWIVYVVGPAANRFMLNTHRSCFSHARGWGPNFVGITDQGLLNSDGSEHAWQRKIVNPSFSMAYMHRHLELMTKIIDERTRDWGQRGEVDLYREARNIAFDVVAKVLIGFHNSAEVDRLQDLFFQLVLHGGPDSRLEVDKGMIRHFLSVRKELDGLLLHLIRERRQSPTDDILSRLISARDVEHRPFTDGELLGQMHVLLIAGHETTNTVTASLLYLLAQHPDYLAQVRAELDSVLGDGNGELSLGAIKSMHVLGRAVDEVVRLLSPVNLLPRGSLEDVAFGGYHIPAGTQVRLAVGAGHRLPRCFADPDRFDPDRFAPPRDEGRRTPYAFVPFGGGRRVCPGANVAQIEMKAAAAHIFRRFDLEPIEEKPVEHRYFSLLATLPGGVHVRVKPYIPQRS